VLAAAGAVAAIVRHRYRSAMAADAKEDAGAETASAGTADPAADSAGPSAGPSASSPDAGVNGKVSASDR
jgi:hypothetical protein